MKIDPGENMIYKILHQIQPFRSILILATAMAAAIFALSVRPAGAAGGYHYSVVAEAMQPVDSSIGYNNFSAYLVTTSNSTVNSWTTYVTQVNLPDGAVITGTRLYGIDNDAAQDFSAYVSRLNQDANPVYSPVTNWAGSSGSPGKTIINLPVASTAAATIDNQMYSYSVFIRLPAATIPNATAPNLAVLRVVIDWSYSTYLPILSK